MALHNTCRDILVLGYHFLLFWCLGGNPRHPIKNINMGKILYIVFKFLNFKNIRQSTKVVGPGIDCDEETRYFT